MELFTPGHLIPLLIIVAVLFFGWKQLPDMSRSLGRSLRIFKTEMKGMTGDDKARKDAEGEAAEPAAEQAAAQQTPRALTKAEVIRPAEAPRPRPRPAPSHSSASSRTE